MFLWSKTNSVELDNTFLLCMISRMSKECAEVIEACIAMARIVRKANVFLSHKVEIEIEIVADVK